MDNSKQLLKPGHTVKAKVTRFHLLNKIVIPSRAIITKTDKRVVMIVDQNKKAKEVEIHVKGESQGSALITKGLKSGDELIIRGHHQTVTGSLVEVNPPQT